MKLSSMRGNKHRMKISKYGKSIKLKENIYFIENQPNIDLKYIFFYLFTKIKNIHLFWKEKCNLKLIRLIM